MGNGRQCEGSSEVGVECTVILTNFSLQEDECNNEALARESRK